MKLSQIAARLSCNLEGDGDIEIRGVAPVETAEAGELSFLVNRKYYPEFTSTKASALIVGSDFDREGKHLLRHANPYLAFARAVELFTPKRRHQPGIHETAYISPTAAIGAEVFLGPFSVIGDRVRLGNRVALGPHSIVLEGSEIGDDTVIHSGVVIRERVHIGKNCLIQDNAVIGSDGFGYAQQDDKAWYPILQTGTVVIEDNVDIGACTTIDRAAMGETRIGAGTKIDNLVQIGHGCQIGKDCLICAQVGLAGSTKVGDNVILAGQVGA
ncbi:MAG: UDP-3-O-(3-hydroxymyristoyl)glucosamine N-acyltransferase, partial [Blastocatellia bacterium]